MELQLLWIEANAAWDAVLLLGAIPGLTRAWLLLKKTLRGERDSQAGSNKCKLQTNAGCSS